MEELLAQEHQVQVGFGWIGPQQPFYRRAIKRMMFTEIKTLQKGVRFLEELVDGIFAADGAFAVTNVGPVDV